MKIYVEGSLERIMGENPVPVRKIIGKMTLIFAPYWGDKLINQFRCGIIKDYLGEKDEGRQANMLTGTLWIMKYSGYAAAIYKTMEYFF